MLPTTLTVNNKEYLINIDPQMPLLWAIRDVIGLTGTKYGCGIAQCGACTLHINGVAVRSCSMPAASAVGKKITTIEGLSEDGTHPLQQAWEEEDVPQCGYCQAGQIMTAAALLSKNPQPSDEEITITMNGNICRCGTYQRIHRAVKKAASSNNQK
jgi:isoquinoline 1-oxidoreductase subunit alpha